jgi:hypothetical protein
LSAKYPGKTLSELACRDVEPIPDADQAEHLRAEVARLTALLAPEQPAPTPGEGDLWLELLDLLPDSLKPLALQRRLKGLASYGVPLQRGNGRDMRQDAIEELLDAVVYSHGAEMHVQKDLLIRMAESMVSGQPIVNEVERAVLDLVAELEAGARNDIEARKKMVSPKSRFHAQVSSHTTLDVCKRLREVLNVHP